MVPSGAPSFLRITISPASILVRAGLSELLRPSRLLIKGQNVDQDALHVSNGVKNCPPAVAYDSGQIKAEAKDRCMATARDGDVAPVAEQADHGIIEVAITHRCIESQVKRCRLSTGLGSCSTIFDERSMSRGAKHGRHYKTQQHHIERHAVLSPAAP